MLLIVASFLVMFLSAIFVFADIYRRHFQIFRFLNIDIILFSIFYIYDEPFLLPLAASAKASLSACPVYLILIFSGLVSLLPRFASHTSHFPRPPFTLNISITRPSSFYYIAPLYSRHADFRFIISTSFMFLALAH